MHLSQAAESTLAAAGLTLDSFLERHALGDWDERGPALEELRFAARHGLRVVATYALGQDETLRIETTADRSETSVMLVRERTVLEVGLVEGYDLWSVRYDRESNVLIAVEQPIVDGWVEALPGPPGHALDAATGTGRHALRLLDRGWRVTAFDASPGMVAVARGRLGAKSPQAEVFESRLEDAAALPAEAFDLVTCGLALSHVEDLRAAIDGLAYATRPGGTVILTDFHPEAYAQGWRADCHVRGTRYLLPHTDYARSDYLRAVEDASLRIEAVRDEPLSAAPPDRLSPAGREAVGAVPLCLAVRARKSG